MATALFSHSACFAHDTGEGHPECADRLRAVLAGLEAEEFLYLDRREAPRATPEQIGRVHPGDFVDRIMRAIPQAGLRYVDGDAAAEDVRAQPAVGVGLRSEGHTSELQSLMRISYAVFCLKKKKQPT